MRGERWRREAACEEGRERKLERMKLGSWGYIKGGECDCRKEREKS